MLGDSEIRVDNKPLVRGSFNVKLAGTLFLAVFTVFTAQAVNQMRGWNTRTSSKAAAPTLNFYDIGGKLTWVTAQTSLPYIRNTGTGVEIDCTKSVPILLSLTLPDNVQGKITFPVEEKPVNATDSGLFYLVQGNSDTVNKGGVALGTRDDRADASMTKEIADKLNSAYPNFTPNFDVVINPTFFFYKTDVTGTGDYLNTYYRRAFGTNRKNLLSIAATPKGGYGKIKNEAFGKEVNLAYLQSNKDAVPTPADIVYPVNYGMTQLKMIHVACPWGVKNNSVTGGKLLVGNPVFEPITPRPADRKEAFQKLALNLLDSLPKAESFSPGGQNPYDNPRVQSILALSYAYLTNDRTTTLKYLNRALELTDKVYAKGYGVSDLALAYWIAVSKYPDIRAYLDNLVLAKLDIVSQAIIADTGVGKIYPVSRYIARSGGNLNAPAGAALTTIGYMLGTKNYTGLTTFGHCLMFNNASTDSANLTVNTTSCDLLRQKGVDIPFTKNIYTASDVNSELVAKAKTVYNSIGFIYDGRLDNHIYGPNPMYIYGGNLGEVAKAAIAWGTNKAVLGTPVGRAGQYGLDVLWKQNLFLIDFDKNLWNSSDVTKLTLKSTQSASELGVLDDSGIWDERFNDANYSWGWNNYKTFSKTETWLDPASGINGLVFGARVYNRWNEVDRLIDYIWYISNDYGGIPYTVPSLVSNVSSAIGNTVSAYKWTDNLSPLYYFENTRGLPAESSINSMEYGMPIIPISYIERYTLSAMLLDPNLNLKQLDFPVVSVTTSISAVVSTSKEIPAYSNLSE